MKKKLIFAIDAIVDACVIYLFNSDFYGYSSHAFLVFKNLTFQFGRLV